MVDDISGCEIRRLVLRAKISESVFLAFELSSEVVSLRPELRRTGMENQLEASDALHGAYAVVKIPAFL